MKEYCVDLELARELQENGFPYHSSFIYHIRPFTGGGAHVDLVYDGHGIISPGEISEHIYAPTSDEILKELPQYIDNYELTILKKSFLHLEECYYIVGYSKYLHRNDWLNNPYFAGRGKLSNNLAQTWLYLKKEGHIK